MFFSISRVFLFVVIYVGEFLEESESYKNIFYSNTEPTCEELKLFWHDVSHARKIAEKTNEIPMVPWQLMTFNDDWRTTFKTRNDNKFQRTYPQNTLTTKNEKSSYIKLIDANTLDPALSPDSFGFLQQQGALRSEGTFGDFFQPPEVIEAIQIGKPIEFLPESDLKINNYHPWGTREDIGTFGNVVGMNDMSLLPNSIVETKGPAEPLLKKQVRLNKQKLCTIDLHGRCISSRFCECPSFETSCNNKRCGPPVTIFGKGNQYGIWHQGPLTRAQLGLHKIVKRTLGSRTKVKDSKRFTSP